MSERARSDVDETPTHVDDHPFDPEPARVWGLCRRCGLAEVAHREALVRYVSDAPRATDRESTQ